MFDAKKFHSTTGKGSCTVKDKKLLNCYLLSEEEVSEIEKIIPAISELPSDVDFGYLETEKSRFGILRFEDLLVLFPVRTENIQEIARLRRVVQNEG